MAQAIGGTKVALTRRGALAGVSAAGTLLLSAPSWAQRSAAVVRAYAPPRRIAADHAVVYRREDEFTGWPHTSGFWDMGNGELLQNFSAVKTDYESPDAISHDNIGRGGASRIWMRISSG